MADFTEQPALTGLPVGFGATSLRAMDPGVVTAIQPYPGRDLQPHLPFPAPGAVIDLGAGARIVWAGRETAFLIGRAAPDLSGLAAVTDQSDGWAWIELTGTDAAAVLARVCPLDLRQQGFPTGTSARSTIGHIPALLIHTGGDRFDIAVFRSMAHSCLHELTAAMRAVAARATR